MTVPRRGLLGWASVLLAVAACRSAEPRAEVQREALGPGVSERQILGKLRQFEASRRAAARFLELPPSDERFGADPGAVVVLSDGMIAGVLGGTSELVWFDAQGGQRGRVEAPGGAVALTEAAGRLLVVGRRSRELWVYERSGEAWSPSRRIALGEALAARAIASFAGRVVVAVESPGRLLEAELDQVLEGRGGVAWQAIAGCAGPSFLRVSGTALVQACVLDHEIVLHELAAGKPSERARFSSDGPFWGVDVSQRGEQTLIAAGGVEDHPLDRSIGSFGNIDSFLYLFAVDGEGGSRRLASINLSELGAVVPKAVRFAPGEAAAPLRLLVAAAGSATALWFEVNAEGGTPVRLAERLLVPPGSTDVALTTRGLVLANPLLDAFVRVEGERVSLVRESTSPSARERLGEALVFTNLMAPFNRAEGPLSRFTCETCHFEGRVDGRVHHTGRGEIRATTKPLFGLFNNRPHFSRALDPDLSKVAHAEFRVAGQNSGHDPVFSLERRDFPWLPQLGLDQPSYDALELREALMAFLMAFTPPRNPRTRGRTTFSDQERRGATLFRDACERCHRARASTDDPSSGVAFEDWEARIFSERGALVWASPEYQKTGVEPYVHPEGARTPSLRRLAEKRPYFTNGSAPDLNAVLARVRLGEGFLHEGDAGAPLSKLDRAALLAFLELL